MRTIVFNVLYGDPGRLRLSQEACNFIFVGALTEPSSQDAKCGKQGRRLLPSSRLPLYLAFVTHTPARRPRASCQLDVSAHQMCPQRHSACARREPLRYIPRPDAPCGHDKRVVEGPQRQDGLEALGRHDTRRKHLDRTSARGDVGVDLRRR